MSVTRGLISARNGPMCTFVPNLEVRLNARVWRKPIDAWLAMRRRSNPCMHDVMGRCEARLRLWHFSQQQMNQENLRPRG